MYCGKICPENKGHLNQIPALALRLLQLVLEVPPCNLLPAFGFDRSLMFVNNETPYP